MSDYTQTNDFSAKDALATGDPNKKIVGAQVDTELSALSTAIASKADIAGEAHTGTHSFAGDTSFAVGVTGIGTGINGKIAAHTNLVVRTDVTTPDEEVDVTADELIVKNTSGQQIRLTTVSETASNIGTLNTAGGITSATVAIDTWYGIWIIHKTGATDCVITPITDTLTDVLGDVAGTYTHGAFVGAVLTDGTSDNIPFIQTNKKSSLVTQMVDYDQANAGTTGISVTLTAPPNSVASFSVTNTGNTAANYILVTEIGQTDTTPSLSFSDFGASSGFSGAGQFTIRADASSQVRIRQSQTSGDHLVVTRGWAWE